VAFVCRPDARKGTLETVTSRTKRTVKYFAVDEFDTTSRLNIAPRSLGAIPMLKKTVFSQRSIRITVVGHPTGMVHFFGWVIKRLGRSRSNPAIMVAVATTISGHRRMLEVTRILNAIDQGDSQAAEQLLPLVYAELRKLAAQRLAQEKPGQTLQATALVHETYLRLVDGGSDQRWNNRGHFFAAAAEAMRRILVECARRKASLKRGGDHERIDLPDLADSSSYDQVDLLALDEALAKLNIQHPEKVQVVKLRFFAGCTLEETAQMLGISQATAQRHWVYARAWLFGQLHPK
jgi:RNA polymerase sigma factor (TIGR02999 family)